MQGEMDAYTIEHIQHALFDEGEFELRPSSGYNDQGLGWDDIENMTKRREYWPNEGWQWNGEVGGEGLLWGGCLESVDEMLRHGVPIPSLEQLENVVLMLETSEEIPSAGYVARVMRALGERGILERVKGVLIGRAKAWEFDTQNSPEEKEVHRKEQHDTILQVVRAYNETVPVVQNLNFGHTDPQVPMPYGGRVRIDSKEQRIFASF